jgi:hypothetical protein
MRKSKKSQPISVRYDLEKFEFAQKTLKKETVQEVLDYFLDNLWWRYHVAEIPEAVKQQPMAPAQATEKKKVSEISLLNPKDVERVAAAEERRGEILPVLSYQELLRLAPEQDTREKREEFLREVTRNRKLSDPQKRAIHAKFPKPNP